MEEVNEEERFDFNLDDSWDAVERVLSFFLYNEWDIPSANGAEALRSLWEQNKKRLLEAIGTPTGRVELTVSQDEALEVYERSSGIELMNGINTVEFVSDYVRRKLESSLYETEPTNAYSVSVVPWALLPSHVYTAILDIFDYCNDDGATYRLSLREIVTGRTTVDRPDPRPKRGGKKLLHGMKLGKYVTIVAENVYKCVPEEAKLIADAASLLISKLSAPTIRVVLSVNPLDILYASYHTTGWRSCHNVEDGEWCTGPISYLLDGATAIAYAYRGDDWDEDTASELVLPNKMWRQMVFFDFGRASCILSRQYPYSNPILEAKARRLAAYTLAKVYGVEKPHWSFKKLRDKGHVILEDEDDGDEAAVGTYDHCGYMVLHAGKWHYHDPESCGLRLRCEGVEGAPAQPVVGVKEIPCVCCGEARTEYKAHDELVCSDCGDYGVRCDNCGEYIASDPDSDSVYRSPDGCYLCENCYYDQCTRCHRCGDTIWAEDALTGADEEPYCDYCWSERFVRCDHCDKVIYRSDAHEIDDLCLCDGCFEDAYTLCDGCNDYYPNDDITWVDDHNHYCGYYCPDCLRELFVVCSGCGEYVPKKYAVEVGSGTYCDACAAAVEDDESVAGEEGVVA